MNLASLCETILSFVKKPTYAAALLPFKRLVITIMEGGGSEKN